MYKLGDTSFLINLLFMADQYSAPIMNCDLLLFSLKWYMAEIKWTPSGFLMFQGVALLFCNTALKQNTFYKFQYIKLAVSRQNTHWNINN